MSIARINSSDALYFERKYGTPTPAYELAGTFADVFGGTVDDRQWDGNVGVIIYRARAARAKLPSGGTLYYGKIGAFGEIVHESELTITDEPSEPSEPQDA